MTDAKLRTALDGLRVELKRTRLSDPAEHERIAQLIHEIEHSGDSHENKREALLGRIGDTVRRLEVEHPTLTGCLGQIANALANIGI